MFVYSVKGNTLKLAGIICLAAVLMLSLLLLVPKNSQNVTKAEGSAVDMEDAPAEEVSASKEEKISYNKIKTNEDRIAFLGQFGWQVENEPTEEVTVKIPKTFDKVLSSYNELQLHQGLDLTKYSGKEVSRYTYTVTNYPDYSGKVNANIIVYNNRVIGGDICSSDVDGFIRELTFPADNEQTDAAVPNTDENGTGAPEGAETENTGEGAASTEGEMKDTEDAAAETSSQES